MKNSLSFGRLGVSLLVVVGVLFPGIMCKKEPAQNCLYTYDHSSTQFSWTAYKFTEKMGVSGTFDEVKVAPPAAAPSPYLAIQGLAFVIPVAGLNSGKPERDQKIIRQFFDRLDGKKEIRGQILSVDAAAKTALIEINLGGTIHQLEAAIETGEGGRLQFSGVMELQNWNALDAIANLNKACFEEHKGKDGVSKLWPDVAITIATTPAAACH